MLQFSIGTQSLVTSVPKKKIYSALQHIADSAPSERDGDSKPERNYLDLIEMAQMMDVVHACKEFGVSPTTYYKMRRRYRETGGFDPPLRRRRRDSSVRPASRPKPNYPKLFALAKRTTVIDACRAQGVSRASYYKMLKRLRETGSFDELSRAPLRRPSKLGGAVFKALERYERDHPRWGARRLADHLRDRGFKVSASTVQRLRARRRAR